MNKLLEYNLVGLALQIVAQADLSYLPSDLVVADRWLSPHWIAQSAYGLALGLGVDVENSESVGILVVVELQTLFRVGTDFVGEKQTLFEGNVSDFLTSNHDLNEKNADLL